ncbi:YTH domain-containing protein, putative [Plasmodium gallinaceum]|uniref:YTH domain-containing protein, putative n=1 Tax=Plasmodium gallinaceum TaxID=5849 RepID=A0A1J1GTU0_PLAGA|nr:YTH domain-containing protein, putative [Plasmodium gallinaceum]CRG95713.1 YTH domain-containing protein, putative [Plasmodium gallinaceum]
MVVRKKCNKKKKKNIYELYLNMCEEKNKKLGEKNGDDIIDLEKEVKIRLEEQTSLLSIKGIDRVDIKQKKGKHSIICIHYIKNMCMKNLFCNYLHQLIYSRIPTCKNYLKYNYCADKVRGSCMFRHTLENTNVSHYNENKDEYLDETLKFLHEKNICVNYLLGFCALGYNCRKIHKNRSRKYINIISILPKFYLDHILINKRLYTHLYNNQKKFLNDLNKLKDALIILSGEKYYDKMNLSKNENENSLKEGFKGSNNNNNINSSNHNINNNNTKGNININDNNNYNNVNIDTSIYNNSNNNDNIYNNSGIIDTADDNIDNTNNYNSNNQNIFMKNNKNNLNDIIKNNQKIIGYNNSNEIINNATNDNVDKYLNECNKSNNEHTKNLGKYNNYNNHSNEKIYRNKINNYYNNENIVTSDSMNIPNVYDLNNNLIQNDKIKVFIIKCNQISHLYLSILYGVWATGKNNTRKFVNLFKENYTIIFLFSVNESGGFQGYAKMITLPIKNLYDNLWGSITKRLGGNFRVQWIKTAKIDFDVFKNMVNSYNDNLPLKKSRDGTELPLNLATIICNKLNSLPNEDFLAGTIYEYKRRINHSTFFTNLHKQNLLNTTTMWDMLIFNLNQKSDCQQITFIDGTEQNIK